MVQSVKIAVIGNSMVEVESEFGPTAELSAEMIRAQLDLLVRDDVFRSSKRSVAFLKYVVEQTLSGAADQIKERTIGVEVFGRYPTYDTNLDHIVRTAATELRKRLATYYVDEKHQSELRMGLIPGSYVPRFTLPGQAKQPATETVSVPSEAAVVSLPQLQGPAPVPVVEEEIAAIDPSHRRTYRYLYLGVAAALAIVGVLVYFWLHDRSSEYIFWQPVIDTPGPVLLAVGDVPKGPPTPVVSGDVQDAPAAIPHPGLPGSVPFADAVTIARVVGVLQSSGKKVLIRRENASSFSDLREGPVVLIGAFNNEWSLRLTHQLRYSLALDTENHLIYIKDAKKPSSRTWSWATNDSLDGVGAAGAPVLHDYALISRIRNSETGHALVVIGGLYTYGTQAAGEFLVDPQAMRSVLKFAHLGAGAGSLQIVLETTVTDGTPGPPKVLAVSEE